MQTSEADVSGLTLGKIIALVASQVPLQTQDISDTAQLVPRPDTKGMYFEMRMPATTSRERCENWSEPLGKGVCSSFKETVILRERACRVPWVHAG